MRHGSIRWYGRRLDSGLIGGFAALGFALANPVNGRSIIFTEDDIDADVEPDGLRAQLDEAKSSITFALWMAPPANVFVTVSGDGDRGLNDFGLDGLDFQEQQQVCAAVLWVAARDPGTRLVVADDYLEDGSDAWDSYVAGTMPLPLDTPKLLLERDESGRLTLHVSEGTL